MCGIAGCYQQPDGQKLVDIMIDRIAHRGPDAAGVWSSRTTGSSVHLGFRRLSIIDLSDGRRPAARQGRPDAHLQRRALQLPRAAGRADGAAASGSRTNSDTEVVLEAWRRWGPDALRRFRGMFAFALLDERTGELHPGPRPVRHQAAVLPAPRRRRGLRLRAQGARGRGSARSCGSSPARWSRRCSTTGCPSSAAPSTACTSCPADRGRGSGRTAAARSQQYWRIAEVAAQAAAGPPADLRRGASRSRSPRTWSPTCRSRASCPAAWTPASSPSLAHQAAPGDRRLHDRLPARGPAARGDARRRRLRPQGGRPATASALHEIEISPDIVDLLPRMVDILDEPIGDPAAINTLLMCEAARDARRQGPAVRHGRRRAVRRLPQAPGLPAGQPATAGCRARARALVAAGRRPAAGRRRRPRPALRRAGPSAS